MSLERQVRIRSPVRVTAPAKRATPCQPTDQVKSDLRMEIELKQAELARLQEQAIAAEEAEAEPSKLKLSQRTILTNTYLHRGQELQG